MKKGSYIYIMGIGGTLMGGIAIMLKNSGYKIAGSDQKIYPPMSDKLAEHKIEVFEGYSADNITSNIELVLVGNVISNGHPEMDEVIKKGIPYSSVPSFLEKEILPKYIPVVVAGTHGKTTTSSLLTTLLHSYSLNPSFIIGGVHQNYGVNAAITSEGVPFVLEGDEYDTAFFDKTPKFSHYMPKVGILTSLEFDHADIYKDIYQLRAVFYRFASMIPADGALIYWDGISGVNSLFRDVKARLISYGFNPSSQIYCYSFYSKKGKTYFSVKIFGKDYEFSINLSGKHNILNALATIAATACFTADLSKIQSGFDSFIPPKRRQEEIINKNGIVVIDDFAHHPTAIKETISAIKMRYPKKRVIALFEPRSNTSRQNIFFDYYIEAFQEASIVCLTTAKPHRLIPTENLLKTDELKKEINKTGIQCEVFEDALQILPYLKDIVKANDVILIMSNGSFDGIYSKIEEIL
ncbi:UDP-N-acetylmuramate:L-alanyl-gamma-D-glutamyl-meso-diaminopimelate ligase [bacterium]|nr:UDP-N-acetylmuramate:L-alanyl-gamma-D-glutamyl-meso-diaminopimelate ligase [bacterium]